MTTLAQAAQVIYTQFIAGWGATSAFTFDNEDGFVKPSGLPWARVTIRHETRAQESLGAIGRRKFEATGIVYVQCFSPLDSGRALADSLATVAQNIFEGKTFPEQIRFTSAAILEVGPTEDWYQINVEAQFYYSETK